MASEVTGLVALTGVDQAVYSYTGHIDRMDFFQQARNLPVHEQLLNKTNTQVEKEINEYVVYDALYGFLKNIKILQCKWGFSSFSIAGKSCTLLQKTEADIKKTIDENLRTIKDKPVKITKHYKVLEENGLEINSQNVAHFLATFRPNVLNEIPAVIPKKGGNRIGRRRKTKKYACKKRKRKCGTNKKRSFSS